MKKKIDALKALGICAAVLSIGSTLFSSFVEDKKTDARIAEKVNEAVKAALEKKED